ncbi:MAG: hypothetical protein EOP23_08720 [Hyphomicrobiales bacterium]|nr:MAG: hypothetical protein EOP23_08720 [Hyphomicrobiales bacterium]
MTLSDAFCSCRRWRNAGGPCRRMLLYASCRRFQSRHDPRSS